MGPTWLVVLLASVGMSRVMATYDTIVIGLGPAGCTAASTLAQAGKKVLALEAQGRIGGRVNTVPFGDGIVELGAEWIHGTVKSRVYDLAIKNNVSLISDNLNFEVFRSDGSPADKELINSLIEYSLALTDDPPATPEPLGQYISRRLTDHIKEKYPTIANDKEFIDSFLFFMDLIIDNYEATNSWNDVTTQSNYEELKGDQHMSWHRNGYKTLFEILLNTYNNGPGYPNLEIQLNKEVTLISWPQDPHQDVVVTCKDGTSHKAKNVIVTVSLGVLKERYTTLITPPLPDYKITSIQKLSIGVVAKIILSFDEIWWPNISFVGFMWREQDKSAVPERDIWTTRMNGPIFPTGSRNTLTMWSVGDDAKLVSDLGYTTLFSGNLPDEKILAIQKISMGVIGKIILAFPEAWWPPAHSMCGFFWTLPDRRTVAESDIWVANTPASTRPMGCGTCFTLWTKGDETKLVETLPEDVVKRKVMELLRRFIGANTTIPEPTAMIRSSWYSNPFTRGSYTYDNLQTPQYPNARVDLGKPLLDSAGTPRVLFAGEATDPTHFSTVHGATDTGYREAMRLLPTTSKI